ncbi:hypothetical protein CYMTET_40045 [Cymbomonas tetramitiformis]|uniref:Uncharacterized protein n=1 Tax=Cymbomonas tetramitiformis TaxID=36881 RepID=A0AAE0F3N0_9CHLO|nr:hypothetical protein CYMTET_40045 [Cymbomonas tetramitiformis]
MVAAWRGGAKAVGGRVSYYSGNTLLAGVDTVPAVGGAGQQGALERELGQLPKTCGNADEAALGSKTVSNYMPKARAFMELWMQRTGHHVAVQDRGSRGLGAGLVILRRSREAREFLSRWWNMKLQLQTSDGYVEDFDNGLLQLMALAEAEGAPELLQGCVDEYTGIKDEASRSMFYRCWYHAMGFDEAKACTDFSDDDHTKCPTHENPHFSQPRNFNSSILKIFPYHKGWPLEVKRRTELSPEEDGRDGDFLIHTKRHDLWLDSKKVYCMD